MKLRDLVLALLLVGAAMAAYHNSLDGVFLYDDYGSIVGNPNITSLSIAKMVEAAPNPTFPRRPLTNFTFALNYAAGQLDVRGYHAVNLAIHVMITLLVFGVVRRTLGGPRLGARLGRVASLLAAAIALVWTVHPLLTNAVDYVFQRAELLMALALLLTLYAVIRSVSSPNAGRWRALAIVSCAAGMASKETMICAPLVVLAYDWIFLSTEHENPLRARRTLYAGLAATWLVLAAIMIFVPYDDSAGYGTGPRGVFEYAFTQAGVILHYIRLAFWPTALLFDYDGWPVARGIGAILSASVVLLLLAATAWAIAKRKPLGFLGAWFFLILAPTSSFFPIPAEIAAEQRMYLPLLAIVSLLVLAWHELARPLLARVPPRGRAWSWVSAAALVLVCVALARATIARNTDYRDDRGMWRDVIAKNPLSSRAHVNLAAAELRRGQVQPAIDEFDRAAQLQPEWALPHFHKGNALRALGRVDESLAAFGESVRLNPEWVDARLNYGATLLQAQRYDEAIAQLVEAVRQYPASLEARNNLGFAYLLGGQTDLAIQEFRLVIAQNPRFARAHNGLGRALLSRGMSEEALAHFEEAVRLDPNLAEAWISLGQLKAAQGKRDEAIRHFQEAIRANPNSIDSYSNLAMTLVAEERVEEAVQVAAQATAVAPQSAVAHHSLGLILSRAGHEKESIAELREAVRLAPDWSEALNNLAWALATSPDATLRDGREAVTLAERACARTEFKLANMLDTLGAAYAEAGRFADASRTAAMAVERAAALGQQGLAEQIARRQDAYDAHRPYREPS